MRTIYAADQLFDAYYIHNLNLYIYYFNSFGTVEWKIVKHYSIASCKLFSRKPNIIYIPNAEGKIQKNVPFLGIYMKQKYVSIALLHFLSFVGMQFYVFYLPKELF